MKRLLIIFSAVVLGWGGTYGVASCKTRATHDPDDEKDFINKDLEILEKMKAEIKAYFDGWWQKKATIDINNFIGQKESFDKIVTDIKADNKLVLSVEAIKKYGILNQLLTGFTAEFENLNRTLRDRYSNYYVNTMPLSLSDNDVHFTLYYINFDKITKLIAGTMEEIKGVTLKFNITYNIRFKQLEQRDEINGIVFISNNIVALSKIQEQLENYFVTFVNKIFKKQDYKIIESNKYWNAIGTNDLIDSIITKKLTDENISFMRGSINFATGVYSTLKAEGTFTKELSVLKWAGEGYDPAKLTKENFLQFYKTVYSFPSEGKYYIKAKIAYFFPNEFMIENLPLKNIRSMIRLKVPIKILVLKDNVDQELVEFAEVVMKFWKYYKLETYEDKHRLVFNMQQPDFNALVRKSNTFNQKITISNLNLLFTSIFDFFKTTLTEKNKFITVVQHHSSQYFKVNLIKNQKSLTVQLFRKHYPLRNYYLYFDANLGCNDFGYSFLFRPDDDEKNINDDGFTFLQEIEFKVKE